MSDDSSDADRTRSFVHLIAGTTVTHYRIISLLGTGGMGEVYVAYDTKLHRKVALKFLAAHLCLDQQCRARFRREAQAAAGINHPHVVHVYEVSEYGDRPFFSMELVKGQSLRDLIMARTLSAKRIVELSLQICDGLREAHRVGVTHRDIKPSNVSVDEQGLAKILDFGLAAVSDGEDMTKAGQLLGTLGYMAPEIIEGQPADTSSDIFSIGVLLYEMITSKQPFVRGSAGATLHAVAHEVPEPASRFRPDLPEELMNIVSSAMSKKRDERPASVDELMRALRAVVPLVEGRGSSVAGSTRPSARPGYRRRLIRWLPWPVLAVLALLFGPDAFKTVLNRPHAGFVSKHQHLAVLPFTDIGQPALGPEYCQGLMETLTSKLTQLGQFHGSLWVVPASEVRQEQVSSPSQARSTFGVNLAVSGSIQQLGESVRMTLNLIDAESERQIRASVIDFPRVDMTAQQDSTVAVLTEMLGIRLPPEQRRVLRRGGTDTAAAYELYLRAQGYMQYADRPDNIDSAIALFQQSLVHDPTYALAYTGLSRAYWRKHNFESDPLWGDLAVSNSRRALELNDQVAAAYVTLGTIYAGTGRHELAVKEFHRALALDSTDRDAYRGLARAFEALQMFDSAEAVYTELITIRPEYWSGHTDLGLFYAYRGRYDEATQQLNRAVALNHAGYDAWNNLGGLCMALGETERAREMWERSVEIEPNFGALSNLGAIRFMNGDFAEAARCYEAALRLNDSDYRIWLNLSSALDNLAGQEARAREACIRAVELAELRRQARPHDPWLSAQLAEAYASLGDRDRANSLANKALELDPQNVEIMVTAGSVFERTGDPDRALSLIAAALSRGFPRNLIESLPGLRQLMSDPRFDSIMNEHRSAPASPH